MDKTNIFRDLDYSNVHEKYLWEKYDFVIILLPINEIDFRNFPTVKCVVFFFPIKIGENLNISELSTFINYLIDLDKKILLIDSNGQRSLFMSVCFNFLKLGILETEKINDLCKFFNDSFSLFFKEAKRENKFSV